MIRFRSESPSLRSQYVLSDAQIAELLLHTTDLRDRIILELMIFGGLRLMEVETLEIVRIDYPGKTITVNGKGYHGRVKLRNVPMPPFLADKLKKYIGRRAHGYVFLGRDGKSPLGSRALENVVKHAGQRVRFRQQCPTLRHLNPHMLRHTCARRMKAAGFDYEEIAKVLGHATIAKVVTLYGTKTFEEVNAKAQERLFNLN